MLLFIHHCADPNLFHFLEQKKKKKNFDEYPGWFHNKCQSTWTKVVLNAKGGHTKY